MPRPTAPRVDAADRDARALDLRRAGLSYRDIGRQMGVSATTAYRYVERGLDRTRREPADGVRELELERLDRLTVEATEVLAGHHVVIQAGKVVVDPDTGLPFTDHGPTLAAIRTLVQVQESRRKLLGLDAPTRVEAKVLTVDVMEARLAELEAELADLDPDAAVHERRRQDLDRRLVRFRGEWSTPGQITRDPARFVGAGLALLLETLDLDDQARETAVVEVEHFLMSRQASP